MKNNRYHIYRNILFLLTLLLSIVSKAQITQGSGQINTGQTSNLKNAGTITLGGSGSYIVDGNGTSGGNLTVFSGSSIVLKPGFHAKKGSTFTASVGELDVPDLTPAPEYNWVSSKVYNGDGNVIAEGKEFYDYLGRKIQSQSRNITDNKIIASQIIYDDKGRAVLTSLPVPISQSKLTYKNGLICNNMGKNYSVTDFDTPSTLNNPGAVNSKISNSLGWYYGNHNTQEAYVPASKYPYTRVEYSKTQPGVARRSAGVGEAYHMGSGHEVMSFSMPASDEELDELRKMDGEVEYQKLIKTISQDAEGRHAVSYASADGKNIAACLSGIRDDGVANVTNDVEFNIDANTRYLDIHIPEGTNTINLTNGTYDIVNLVNDQQIVSGSVINGNYTFSSSNLNKGRFYRVRSKSGAFTLTQSINYYGHAFNVYDKVGRLKKSYSPKVVAEKNASMCSTYKYNSQGWLISTTSPDQIGATYYRYRKDGQIRFSQNPLQASRGECSYTNYDDFGRPEESGVFNYEQAGVSFTSINADTYNPSSHCSEQTYTMYGKADTQLPNVNGLKQKFMLGKVSKTWTGKKEGNGPEDCITWYSYTYDGNVAWVIKKINGLGGKTFSIEYDYDFTGNVKSVIYQRGQSDEFAHYYEYDADNRLAVVKTKAASESSAKTQAKYHYYQHGPLKRVELAENLQGIDYVYTIDGALKSINHPNLDSKDPGKDGYSGSHSAFKKDVFALGLDYYKGDYLRSGTYISSNLGTNYTGNIHAQRWKTRLNGVNAGDVQNLYTYEYYKNNWMKQATYGSFNRANGSANLGNDYKVTIPKYDANGNIVKLNRNAYGSQLEMDVLTYHYSTGKNQLDYVHDAQDPSSLMDIDCQSSGNYTYDEIGQMTGNNQDKHYFDYDVTGKVTAVYSNSARSNVIAKYKYDDRGFRIKKETSHGNTWYIRDASGNVMGIYTQPTSSGNIALKELALYGSGRIGLAQVNASQTNYVYELADHLGNVRATVQKESNGSLKLISAADYYPFGMIMPNRSTTPGEYRFGYQGQFAEKDEETGYNQFELRLWDGRLGRWLTTDPYEQFHSPYLGMGNSPLMGVDPDGGDWYTSWFGKKQKAFEGSGFVFGYKRNMNGSYMLPEASAIGRRMAMFKQWTPNWAQKIELQMEANEKGKILDNLVYKLTYSVADDFYVWGTRNFTSNARHISGFLANDNEVRESGFSAFTTAASMGYSQYFKGMKGLKQSVDSYRPLLCKNSTKHITKGSRQVMMRRHNMKLDQNPNLWTDFKSFLGDIGNFDKFYKTIQNE
ncbi:hypothetical protein DF185_22645 [Marinifilum breve]|uniref:RHS repeat-associated core domain-containing protein n=1 Tax=Marinifilum breve TaxID=2184082 RepID=A0A2V3ZRK3_9BACT|nr:RHS repeat-associated core domain-containing protein [Marinifilum breve]PXX95180.1 hypothetical protein DF185_22645 [Marinifilum breve]